MVYSTYVKQRILFYRRSGKSYADIVRRLSIEGHRVTKSGICNFLKNYKQRGTEGKARKPGTGSASKINEEIRRLIDARMEEDDETTAVELQQLLKSESYDASLSTILRWRMDLGWTSKGTKYCQMIHDANKEKRLKWAEENIGAMNFDNVVFTDETTVQLENHRRTCCYKYGKKP